MAKHSVSNSMGLTRTHWGPADHRMKKSWRFQKKRVKLAACKCHPGVGVA